MAETVMSVSQTPCQIRQIDYFPDVVPCPQCGHAAPRVSTALRTRTAIDIDLEQPTLLQVRVSVHRCQPCGRYVRAQPPFLRKDAIYSQRVVQKVLDAVYKDGMAFHTVGPRLARDFCVRPSETMIRRWCQAYAAGITLEGDYVAWVAAEFSGILCVDEVYQHDLALLVAVDPAAPAGDRLVGYQLVQGSVTGATMATFLTRLAAAGIQPAEVITDGSSLYPRVLAAVWPQAAHQLCLFHESRRLTRAVEDVVKHLQTTLPVPETPASFVWGPTLAAARGPEALPRRSVERWQTRHAARTAGVAQVAALSEQGFSQHAIARQLGINRRTVQRWLAESTRTVQPLQDVVEVSPLSPPSLRLAGSRPRPTPALLDQIRALRALGQPYRQIAASVGLHHSTVAQWLARLGTDAPSPVLPSPGSDHAGPAAGQDASGVLAPPAPWRDWAQVHQVREALREHRYLLLRHPARLRPAEQAQVDVLLGSPVGATLRVARTFLLDWWAIWRDVDGHKRPRAEAEALYTAWQDAPLYAALAPLARARAQITPQRFAHLSQFLRHASWEATNNGAERAGRAFRHSQAPHFNLRTTASIDADLRVAAYQRMEQARWPQPALVAQCRRGQRRRKRPDHDTAAA